MTPGLRRARVRAFAKINLGLKVLHRRPDGYHELRTVFQTVSLADTLGIAFEAGPRTSIETRSNLDIPGNLVDRAASLLLDALRMTGRVTFELIKRIPLGAGLGGGSSDAAAVLLALPVLAGRSLDLPVLLDLASQLGSDVPFFLLGGRALGLGRGTEVYPLPETPGLRGLLVVPDIHVATAEAYGALGRPLTSEPPPNMISSFQSSIWHQAGSASGISSSIGENDFEPVVLEQHPRLKSIRQQLESAGASAVLLSGSGSAMYGVFASPPDLEQARRCFQNEKVFPMSFVSRARYRSSWWRRLEPHIAGRTWPPQSRYA